MYLWIPWCLIPWWRSLFIGFENESPPQNIFFLSKHHCLIFPLNAILKLKWCNLWPNFPLNTILNLKWSNLWPNFPLNTILNLKCVCFIIAQNEKNLLWSVMDWSVLALSLPNMRRKTCFDPQWIEMYLPCHCPKWEEKLV